jgi:uncharacterized membrane protein
VLLLLWFRFGKDPKSPGTVIAQYEPLKELPPILSGFVVSEKFSMHDIVAQLISLANRGFISIERQEKKLFIGTDIDYQLTILKDTAPLDVFDRSTLEVFFDTQIGKGVSINLSSLKLDRMVQTRVASLAERVKSTLVEQGYFEKNFNRVKAIPVVFIFIGFGVFLFGTSPFHAFMIFTAIAIAVAFIFFMGKKTQKGVDARWHLLGFRQFLSVTEKERYEFHNAPERSPKQFMEFLPYAIAFGVEKKWGKQFEGLGMEQPRWYRDTAMGGFAIAHFVDSIDSFDSSVSDFADSSSGSGGGGSSGGGGGGGGGGSW